MVFIDDGIIIFKGKWINEDIMRWIQTFQLRVNDLYDSNGLQFTAENWQPDMNTTNICTKLNDKITLLRGKYFPYLDVAMYWNENNEL